MASENLLRRQYLVSRENEKKIHSIAAREKVSAAEVVRRAVESYDPDNISEAELEEAIDLMAASIADARKAVRDARRYVRAGNKEYRESRSQ